MRGLASRILAAAWVAILIGACWLLWESRPPLAPIRDGGLARLLGLVAWVGGLLLVTGLLVRLLAREPRRTVGSLPIRNLRRHGSRWPGRPVGGYADRAFPLIPSGAPLPVAEPSVEATRPVPARGERRPQGLEEPTAQAVISLLGPPAVSAGRRRGRGLRGGTRELLCYLALRPGGAQRDQITDALWPRLTPEQARKRLWRAAADARAQLGESSLYRDGEHYELNREEVSVDLDRLDQALGELAGAEHDLGQLGLLEQTLALFTGEPLAGSDFPWAENEQRRLHAIRLDLFERTGRALLAGGDAAGALSRAEEGLASEPYNEKLARLAMRAEATLGLRMAVIGRYERLSGILEEQLGLQPHLETRRLYRQLLGQDHEQEPLPTRGG